jgi:hypothetical protein
VRTHLGSFIEGLRLVNRLHQGCHVDSGVRSVIVYGGAGVQQFADKGDVIAPYGEP